MVHRVWRIARTALLARARLELYDLVCSYEQHCIAGGLDRRRAIVADKKVYFAVF